MFKRSVLILGIIIILCGLHVSYALGIGTTLDLGYTSQISNFRWSIAGDLSGQNPNVLSELAWTDLKIKQVKFGFESTLGDNLFLKGIFAPGWLGDGLIRDSDYLGDNRTIEFSRSMSWDNGDTLLDTTLVFGLNIKHDNFQVRPLLGYSFSGQKLRMSDGVQLIPDTSFISGLNSTYQARWNGPMLGMEIQTRKSKRVVFLSDIEYHWSSYVAAGDWNLRDDLEHPVSFRHSAQGNGIVLSIGADFTINQKALILLNAGYQFWLTGTGTDRIFQNEGVEESTRFNGVNLQSYMLTVGVRSSL